MGFVRRLDPVDPMPIVFTNFRRRNLFGEARTPSFFSLPGDRNPFRPVRATLLRLEMLI